ncbi:hypothetical protein ES705_18526 [subsurface metagenome]
MLKWKRHRFTDIDNNVEKLTDILAGLSGKNRVIKYLGGDIATTVNTIFFRVYRDAEQIVDFDCKHITTAHPFVPMNLPLAEGQLCKAGFFNLAVGADQTPSIVIGYEEAD